MLIKSMSVQKRTKELQRFLREDLEDLIFLVSIIPTNRLKFARNSLMKTIDYIDKFIRESQEDLSPTH